MSGAAVIALSRPASGPAEGGGKSLKSLGSRLAGFLLSREATVAVAAAALSGCLAVQDIQEYQEPPVVNFAPQLNLVNGVVPDVPTVVCLSGGDEDPPEFRLANIVDRNGEDTPSQKLSVRWFFDYQRQAPGNEIIASDTLDAQLDPLTQRTTATYGSAVLPSKRVYDRLNDVLPHQLVAVVSDGFARGAEKEPLNRATADGFFAVSHTWVVAKGGTWCR